MKILILDARGGGVPLPVAPHRGGRDDDRLRAALTGGKTTVVKAAGFDAAEQQAWSALGLRYGYRTLILGARSQEQSVREVCENEAYRRGWTTPISDHDTDLVAVVGDVQSCPEPLARLIASVPDPERVTWVFVGDLYDRGPDAAGVARLLDRLPRQVRVTGNHEEYVRAHLVGTAEKRWPDTERTVAELRAAGYLPHRVLAALGETVPLHAFRRGEAEFVVTHGGVDRGRINAIRRDDHYVTGTFPDSTYIYGIGQDFAELADDQGRWVQLHGHRGNHPEVGLARPDAVPGVLSLESRVEHRGGALTAALIDRSGSVEIVRH